MSFVPAEREGQEPQERGVLRVLFLERRWHMQRAYFTLNHQAFFSVYPGLTEIATKEHTLETTGGCARVWPAMLLSHHTLSTSSPVPFTL
jgi:hypothetical protein